MVNTTGELRVWLRDLKDEIEREIEPEEWTPEIRLALMDLELAIEHVQRELRPRERQ